jgi:acetolactate synthase small subunit
MLALVRISVPDRPGVLGDVASALGTAGADIVQLQVLQSEAGRALDDVHVQVSGRDHLDRVQHRLAAMPGVQVLGVRVGPAPTTGHSELELVGRMLTAPGRAVQTLVDGVPESTGSDWAAVVRYDDAESVAEVVASSPTSPGLNLSDVRVPLRLSVIDGSYAAMALIPLGGTRLGLVVVRESGPAFHPAELWRLEQVGAVAGHVIRATVAASAQLEVIS